MKNMRISQSQRRSSRHVANLGRRPSKFSPGSRSVASISSVAPRSAPFSSTSDFGPRTSSLTSPVEPRISHLTFRPYQQEAFDNRSNGIECWLWGRQTGKSFTLAAWAVDRLVTKPGRLVTILSNSLANGAELNHKCAEIARLYSAAFEQSDLSTAPQFDCMNYETRLSIGGRVGRIKILPANPRTARGFSGDLILDEFAFHENSAAIWEAAEPILSANPDFLCRIASTPNGRHNMFYRLVTDPGIVVRRVPRSEAWRQGLPIYHPITRESITPDQARALAQDKRAYDQNYECIFESENMMLLTLDLISAAEDPAVGVVCDGEWSQQAEDIFGVRRRVAALESADTSAQSTHGRTTNGQCRLSSEEEIFGVRRRVAALESADPSAQSTHGGMTNGDLRLSSEEEIFGVRRRVAALGSADASAHSRARTWFVGVDVGRSQDLTVISVVERDGPRFFVRAILRLRNVRLPQQQELLEVVCRSPRFCAAQIDMTGLGLGLYEYTRQKFGDRIRGLNFASSIPVQATASFGIRQSKIGHAPAPEVLALRLLQVFESRQIRHPVDALLREDLRKPERITTPDGRVSIVASRSESGHADHFWSLALAVDAAMRQPVPVVQVVRGLRPERVERGFLV